MAEHLTSKTIADTTLLDEARDWLQHLQEDGVSGHSILSQMIARLERAAVEPPAPSSPPADHDQEPSRADKLRAALEPAGVKVTVLGEDEAIERLEQQKENLLNALEAKQARIDAIMLEYCPGEMSASQRAAWSASQELASVPPADAQVKINNLLAALYAKQAKIDALMFEFCPGEMSAEQRAEWAKYQRATVTKSAAPCTCADTNNGNCIADILNLDAFYCVRAATETSAAHCEHEWMPFSNKDAPIRIDLCVKCKLEKHTSAGSVVAVRPVSESAQ